MSENTEMKNMGQWTNLRALKIGESAMAELKTELVVTYYLVRPFGHAGASVEHW
jgi:hypothetical protein